MTYSSFGVCGTSLKRFASYKNALTAISKRAGTPLPSLIVSFAILHELPAIVPIASALSMLLLSRLQRDGSIDDQYWVNTPLRSWVNEGEQWAGRVVDQTQARELSGKLAEDVANAVLAYGAVKVFFFFTTVGIVMTDIHSGTFTRLSLYLSPMFSRTPYSSAGGLLPAFYRMISDSCAADSIGGLCLLGRRPKSM
ncbi:uncharacterized protein HD556DRAFT_1418507 [Suillus plorans]|uniref:Uncharacterized protein n=1 Tax=Suillus plorans TaxID=116603 RepID=A0A9P7ABD4_9AGAM|nr:uncharacterized protein HD556DRAFT_1418507 [Suillus plorans]KAG1785888.1 hypothetical protein HD556DRAFT_1418507 [Suillus plorans]